MSAKKKRRRARTPASTIPRSASVNRSSGGVQGRRAERKRRPGALVKFLRTPKGTVLALLIGLMLVALLHPSDRGGWVNVAAAMGAAVLVDVATAIIRRYPRSVPDGGMVSGLIVGLVLSPITPWFLAALAGAVAAFSKHVIKTGRKPVFNPAALALLLTLWVFHSGQSWWGDFGDLPVWVLPLLLAAGFYMSRRVGKFTQVLTFLGTYGLILTLAGGLNWGSPGFTPGDALRPPLINAALFMAFFMLTDPPTSPAKERDQVWFGALSAAVAVVIYLAVGGLAYLLVGLLLANTVKWLAARSKSRPLFARSPVIMR